ncbi:hypothetical protein I6A60_08565 [Frankia sp. AgB1.9]|uniref:hypothetical protein n=1 Tax=unclassified Frankia TaxID=2632575 RepID=UPI001932F581|nr:MULTISPECIES: hypothetical protein [unclassified Frankia]MBL7487179.1 hypothetical protein [Frankia sp. AgW1.1]MBL7547924.1 hypothetical protein [Frankia sp. AgB1.9]MBL7623952.1 hypothetical protein [Frankia sp. AgB1.8]
MARDTELDRLKIEQDQAFQRKQSTYQTQTEAWERRSAAREAMDRAYDAKQAAYEVQNDAWQALQRVRDNNGPRIDSLNTQQETAFQNMKDAFDNASSAYDSRDGASASAYAEEGRGYKAEAQECVAERRQLVQEIRDARDRHEATKPAFQQAKATFDHARIEHNRAKARHEEKQAEFKRAKSDFERAKDAFKRRLEAVRGERQRRKDDKRSIAERAGVPNQYLDNVWVSTAHDGTYNVYFGGVGEPAGPGHGHYAMESSGNVTYRRDPYDPHGSQNFTDYEDRQRGVLYDRSVSSEGPRGARGIYSIRDREGHATQYYADGTRVSWDLDEEGNRVNEHWTDQNVSKGRDSRHDPPPHAR